MSLNVESVGSQQLGHLGLMAGVIHDLGLMERIDGRLCLDSFKGGIVRYGQRVASMILNGLGFMTKRLYMTSHFFSDKPIPELLGPRVNASHLNDNCLGRCLDKIADYGVTLSHQCRSLFLMLNN